LLTVGNELLVRDIHVVLKHAIFRGDGRAGMNIVKSHVELDRREFQSARVGVEPNSIFDPIERPLTGRNIDAVSAVSG
jgi:hypothetical protein